MKPDFNTYRVRTGMFSSNDDAGFNGFFRLAVNGEWLKIIASDGYGWQHVSVSKESGQQVPNWGHMSAIKELFWGDDVWVVQFHPARSEYVNNHPGVLHLWRPTEAQLPTPPAILVGIKGRTAEEHAKMSQLDLMKEFVRANAESGLLPKT